MERRGGLLGHHGGRQTGGAAADDDDVTVHIGQRRGRVLAGVGGEGDAGGFQPGLGHGVGYSRLDGVAGEGRAGHRVHHRGARGQDPFLQQRKGPADNGGGVMILSQLQVGDGTALKGDIQGQLPVIAGSLAGVGSADSGGGRVVGGRFWLLGTAGRQGTDHGHGAEQSEGPFERFHFFSSLLIVGLLWRFWNGSYFVNCFAIS